ncbi:nitrilase-related carbon-nitrogen hydrolase, partial [Desulfuromonas acetoxidans]
MKHDVTAAAVQFNISLGEIDHNLATASEGLRRVAAQGAQLAVLPEMWSTGYDYRHLSDLAEQTPRVLITLQSLSLELKLVIVGSLPEKDGNALYNTLYVIDQGKQVGHYRKTHLFSSWEKIAFWQRDTPVWLFQPLPGQLWSGHSVPPCVFPN